MTDINEAITPEFISQEVARAKTYYLVMLIRGPRERNDQKVLDDLQLKHLQHLFALRQTGKLVLNGPSLIDSEFRGLCIFNVSSLEEVQGYVEEDPLVKAGFLVAEIYPWMGLPGDQLP
jgi:uncharacterized protein YciI